MKETEKTKLYQLVLSWCGGEGDYEGQLMQLYTSYLCPSKNMCIQQILNDPEQFRMLAGEIRYHVEPNKNIPPMTFADFDQAMTEVDKYPGVQQFALSLKEFLPRMARKNSIILSRELKGFRMLPDCLQLHWEQFTAVIS